jgi:two-component system phosphate regulon sensor histidine kinase PhoR
LEVADNGKGIPGEMHEKIFERFYQAQQSENPGISGHGLGLAIAQGLVEAHGSKISLESAPEKGSCFRFYLSVCN